MINTEFGKRKKIKLTVIILILSVAFLCLIGYSANREKMSLVENGVGVTINSVQGLFYDVFRKTSNSFQFITNISKIKKENEELRKINSKFQTKAKEYNAVIKENESLRSKLNFPKERYNYIGVDIIGLIGNGYTDGIEINAGEDKGIKKGMLVMTEEGVVGLILSVGNNRSIVQCLSNANIEVAALVHSTRNQGIVKGYKDRNNNSLAKIQLPLDSNVKKDDVIVTSKYGGLYPSGIRIGSVISVYADKGAVMKIATLKPDVNLEKIEKIEKIFIVAPQN